MPHWPCRVTQEQATFLWDYYCYYDTPVNDWPLRGCATDDSVCIKKRSDVKKKKGSCEHNNLSPVVEVFNRSNCSVLYLLLNLIDQWLFFSVVAGCFDSVGRFLGKCQQSFLWYEECQKSFCFQLCGKEMLALFLQPLWCMLFHHILTDPWLLFGNQIKNKFSEDLLV